MRAYIIIILSGLIALTSCCKSNEDRPNILKDATLNINVRDGLRSEGNGQTLLTPREVVEKTDIMKFLSPKYKNTISSRGFSDAQRDFKNNRLKMWASDVILDRGGTIELETEFLLARDVTLIDARGDKSDTIAYIPNKVLEQSYKDIREAFEKKDYQRVYELFEQAYTAIPITGEQYKELKRQGKN